MNKIIYNLQMRGMHLQALGGGMHRPHNKIENLFPDQEL